jgi:hypothetical protein
MLVGYVFSFGNIMGRGTFDVIPESDMKKHELNVTSFLRKITNQYRVQRNLQINVKKVFVPVFFDCIRHRDISLQSFPGVTRSFGRQQLVIRCMVLSVETMPLLPHTWCPPTPFNKDSTEIFCLETWRDPTWSWIFPGLEWSRNS